jgi:hypothetical protein
MTTSGAEGPIAATRELEAVRACLLESELRAEPCAPAPDGSYRECLKHCFAGSWAAYKHLAFGGGMRRFVAKVATATLGGQVELRLDAPDGWLIGTLEIERTGGWENWCEVSCPVEPVGGVHALYLVFRHREGSHSRQQVCDLETFRFEA